MARECTWVIDNGRSYLTNNDGDRVVTSCTGTAEQLVQVRLVHGKYLPCEQCKYYFDGSCIVPKGRHHSHLRTPSARVICQCELYEPK